MTPIEARYFQHLDEIGPMGCMEKAANLFGEICEMVGHQIDLESPGLPPRERKLRIAERLYMNEPETLRLLQRARELGDNA